MAETDPGDLTVTAVNSALSAGITDFAALLATALPDARVHEGPDLAFVDSGLPDSTFNFVYRSRPADAELGQAVIRLKDHFRERGLPFRWTIGLRGEPSQMAEILAGEGLRFAESEPAMGLDVRTPPRRDATAAVPGLRVVPVTNPELLRQWMLAWGCGAPGEVIDRWYRVYAALPHGPAGSLRMFLGLLDAEPVATVYLHLVSGSATVHYVVTRPEYRRRGIGAAMTEAALREARAAGCHRAVLTASELGVGVYRRLGFRETGLATTYVWQPEWEQHAG